MTKLPEPILSAKQSETIEKQAQRELASRELARRDLALYAKRMMPGYDIGWFHRELADALMQFYDDVINKRSPRLAIWVPPRHGKSQMASIFFPTWALGKDPSLEFVVASYAASLSTDMSKKAREVMRSTDYQVLFPQTSLHRDLAASDEWKTTKMGGYMAVGVDGGLTGRGAHVLIIDDPVSNRQEAESESITKGVYDWYSSVARTRLHPGGGILLIQTRWSMMDLSARIMERKANGFKIIRYPAVAEEDEKHRKAGEALHPERYSLSALEEIKADMLTRDWEALFQQNPVPASGSFFKADHFKFYTDETLPPLEDLAISVTWDISTGKSTDFSAGVVAGFHRDGNVYILDVINKRLTSLELTEMILDTHKKWSAQRTGVEVGQIASTIDPILTKRMAERKEYITIYRLKPGRANKVARAMSIAGMMERGKVFFNRDAMWFGELEAQMLAFPGGRSDDMCDALAYVAYIMAQITPPRMKQPPKRPSWKDKLKKLGKSDDGTWMSA